MKGSFFEQRISSWLLACMILLSGFTASAQKIWTRSSSGNWGDGTNWSGNIPPSSSSVVYITNANTKTVTIDAATPAANLTITTLRLGALPGATNTLFLSSAGTNNPLVCQVAFTLADGASMRITNSALFVDIINSAADIDGSMTLDDGWITFGDTTVTARVGRATSGKLVVNSGTVTAGAITVGGLTNSSGVVTMNGGRVDIATLFSIGRNPSTTGSVFMVGGQLTAINDTARIGDQGVGQMTVSNSLVVLTNLNVGRDPLSVGTFTLQNGGLVSLSGSLSIARFSGSTGTVFVTGGLLAATNDNIYVGREGSGQMTISNGTVQADSLLVAADFTNTASGTFKITGGNLNLSANLIVGSTSLSTGYVSVTGGMVTVTNPAGTAVANILNGSLTLNGGSLTADNLFLTNATGQFVFNGGTLNASNATVANGSAFVVGNGVAPATLNLNGGTLSFANGLTISSNATLTGCGTIIGTIVNHGVIAINCGGLIGITNTILTSPVLLTNRQFQFTILGQAGQTYVTDASTNLQNWLAISTNIAPSNIFNVIDPSATNTRFRFYRTRKNP